jgi:hypothetical protein
MQKHEQLLEKGVVRIAAPMVFAGREGSEVTLSIQEENCFYFMEIARICYS